MVTFPMVHLKEIILLYPYLLKRVKIKLAVKKKVHVTKNYIPLWISEENSYGLIYRYSLNLGCFLKLSYLPRLLKEFEFVNPNL